MSDANSGGVFSSAVRTASTISDNGSIKASFTCELVISMVFGAPATKSRPLISMVFSSSKGYAFPI